jgi:peroxiredoxin
MHVVMAKQGMMDQLNAGGHQSVFPSSSAGKQDVELVELFARTKTESGRTLLSLLDEKPMLLVFLRHFGSPSCREALADVSKARAALEERGVRPVFVHLGTPERAQPFFDKVGLGDVERVSDPSAAVYQAPVFHLLKTTAVPEFFAGGELLKCAQRQLWRYGKIAGLRRPFGIRGWRTARIMSGLGFSSPQPVGEEKSPVNPSFAQPSSCLHRCAGGFCSWLRLAGPIGLRDGNNDHSRNPV